MLSIILPTFNEAANLPELLDRLHGALAGKAYEIIVVDDDSPDRTWEEASLLAKHYPALRVVRRVGKRGLSSAVVDGFAQARGDILLVMDSDLQHDPALVLRLAREIENGADIAVASRYREGGSVGDWVTGRRLLSKTATALARTLPRVCVSDPMSGFFALKRASYAPIADRLHPTGFKILLEILAALPRSARTAEVPLVFGPRRHGKSKLSLAVEGAFLLQLLRIALRRCQRWLWWGIVLTAAFVLGVRVWALRFLFFDAGVRGEVRRTLAAVSEEQGWPLSDVLVREVERNRVRVLHRQHHRGRDETACLLLPFTDAQPLPCPAP